MQIEHKISCLIKTPYSSNNVINTTDLFKRNICNVNNKMIDNL